MTSGSVLCERCHGSLFPGKMCPCGCRECKHSTLSCKKQGLKLQQRKIFSCPKCLPIAQIPAEDVLPGQHVQPCPSFVWLSRLFSRCTLRPGVMYSGMRQGPVGLQTLVTLCRSQSPSHAQRSLGLPVTEMILLSLQLDACEKRNQDKNMWWPHPAV